MEMPGFYEQLRGLPQDSRNLAVTVLEGEFYGNSLSGSFTAGPAV